MGKSDGCGGSRPSIQYTHLVFFLVLLLHKQPRIIDFFHHWEILMTNFMIILRKHEAVCTKMLRIVGWVRIKRQWEFQRLSSLNFIKGMWGSDVVPLLY